MVSIFISDRSGREIAIEARPGRSLMETLRDAGLPIAAICGGNCICSTCHILVDDEWVKSVPLISEEEIELLESESHYYDPHRSRLSCQIPSEALPDGFRARLVPEG